MALFGRSSPREQQRALAWGLWVRQRNPFAIASLVLGLFSLIEFGANLVFGIAGVVLGVIALKQLHAATGDSVVVSAEVDAVGPWVMGHRLAWGGIVLSVLSLIVAELLYFRVFG